MRKKTIKLAFLLLLVIMQTGCKVSFFGRTEINKIEFVRAIGIDKPTDKEGYVRLTIATQKIREEGNGAGQKKQSNIIVSEGRTVLEAIRNYWNYMDKRPFWGHVEYALIGEEAAKDGILKYIDYFCRDPEVRLNMKLFETKGSSAEDVMKKGGGENRFIFDQLQGVMENESGQSIINVVDLVEVMYILDKEYLCLYMPCLEMQQKTISDSSNDSMDVTMGGFAVFEGDKLALLLDTEMGRGLNWLRNEVKSGIIAVKSPEGNNVSLEIVESDVKLKPDLSDGKLTVHVDAVVSSSVAEIQGSEMIFTRESLAFLERGLKAAITNEIEQVIHLAQEKNMDFFSTGDAVFHKYPIEWEDEFRKKWKTAFAEIKFDVNVTAVITGTYNITQPNRIEKGDRP